MWSCERSLSAPQLAHLTDSSLPEAHKENFASGRGNDGCKLAQHCQTRASEFRSQQIYSHPSSGNQTRLAASLTAHKQRKKESKAATQNRWLALCSLLLLLLLAFDMTSSSHIQADHSILCLCAVLIVAGWPNSCVSLSLL